jgi:hypothetical protein
MLYEILVFASIWIKFGQTPVNHANKIVSQAIVRDVQNFTSQLYKSSS